MSESEARRPVGVRDVARRAGVSTQTVSRVLNDYPGIRDETRQRVLDAVAALDYRMNNAARALGTRRSRIIGVVASDTALYGPSAGIAALEAAARERGRWVATAYADADDADSVLAAVGHLLAQGVDGIVLVAPHVGTRAAVERAAITIPIVSLHAEPGARQADGAGLAVAHLAELGHVRIAEIAGPSDWLESSVRSEGIAAAAERSGVAVVARWEGDWTAASGHALAAEISAALAAPAAPTGVVVANDQMALGLIAGLTERGIAVPGVLSIVGFDDNPDAAFYTPALTTVRVDVAGEAGRALDGVLGATGSEPAAPRLVVRASTAAPLA
ncbi:LacI family DNA-binding transcriptional regulator [Labedella phragmitis]|uniref:LacI family DNA-binding transcriptional regulator n=1 Tax=Labedella phragmitis TaxID=2498849 RepID=A0A444PTH1_9MICO|nr:substrate-binding domain-containing protein [Labedella phragmitis]RWZ51152.1 LacI family DNA-binding transcriptional regulator [Labedella phragmitis]